MRSEYKIGNETSLHTYVCYIEQPRACDPEAPLTARTLGYHSYPMRKCCAYYSSIFLKPSGVGRKKAPHPCQNLWNRCVYDLTQQEKTSGGDLRWGEHLYIQVGPTWTTESLKGKEAELEEMYLIAGFEDGGRAGGVWTAGGL